MSKQIAKNTFTGGLQMDLHPLSSQNTVLTNALNASLVTIDGDEMILQNDMGNLKAVVNENDENPIYVTLSEGFIPLGINTLNGIAYIVSYNPNTLEGEIGTFPSPQYNILGEVLFNDNNDYTTDSNKLINQYQPLYNLYKGCRNCTEEIEGECIENVQEIDQLLYPLRTQHFNFDLEHPIDVELQPSYDGSVNIIINDGKNIPRLINSRFAAKEDGTWEIPDRNKNTNNIYRVYNGCRDDYREPMCNCSNNIIEERIDDSECGCIDITCEQELENQKTFDISTSLNKRIDKFPITVYNGVINNGNLPVGNYVLYYKYCDEDGNETDFIGESGIISVFKGNDKDPFSIDGGERDMDSDKSISVILNNIDTKYSFVKVYYSRTSAAADENRISEAYEILKPYPTSDNNICNIIITGDEEKQQIPITELNQSYATINSSETQVQIGNRLFLGNIQAQKTNYKDLKDLTLRIFPFIERRIAKDKIGEINPSNYLDDSIENQDEFIFSHEYYNTKNIYYNVGYWNEEYYRLGIVYIYDDGSLSPVFNTIGYKSNSESILDYSTEMLLPEMDERILKINDSSIIDIPDIILDGKRNYLNTSKDGNSFGENSIKTSSESILDSDCYLNTRGVIQINDSELDNKNNAQEYLYYIKLFINSDIVEYLKDVLCIKGFFVVRQKRIPTILAQGFTLPWDKEAKVPIIEHWNQRLMPTQPNGKWDFKNTFSKFKANDKYGEDFTWHYYWSDFIPNKCFELTSLRCYEVESFLDQISEGGKHLDVDDGYDYGHPNNRKLMHHYLPRMHDIPFICVDQKMLAPFELKGDQDDSSTGYIKKYNLLASYDNRENYYDLDTVLSYGLSKKEKINISFLQTGDNPRTVTNEIDFKNSNRYEIIERYLTSTSTPSQINQNTQITINGDTKDYQLGDTSFESAINAISSIVSDYPNVSNLHTYRYFEIKIFAGQVSSITGDYSETSESYYPFGQNITQVTTYQKEISEQDEDDYENINGLFNDLYKIGYLQYKEYFRDQFIDTVDGKITQDLSTNFDKIDNYKKLQRVYSDGKLVRRLGNYYMLWKIRGKKWKEIDSIKGKDANWTKALEKHYGDLYRNVDGNQATAICPEFEVRQPFFNQLFTGAEYPVRYTIYQHGVLHRSAKNERYYYQKVETDDIYCPTNTHDFEKFGSKDGMSFKICSVTDNVPIVAIDNTIFQSVLGTAEEAYRIAYINEEHSGKAQWTKDDKNDNHYYCSENAHDWNLARGIFSPYLGIIAVNSVNKTYINKDGEEVTAIQTERDRRYCRRFNIYIKDYKETKQQFNIRYQDISPYYAISERVSFNEFDIYPNAKVFESSLYYDLFRGDCFFCTFTHRLNRNFNDPTAPTNDKIVDEATWLKHYQPDENATDKDITQLSKINRGDVNAVKLGSWITIKVRSSYNLSIRSLDERYTTEAAMMGRARGFYPLQQASADGGYKIPNSYLINDGFGSTLGEKQYFTLPDAPYYNDYYADRIVYSDVNVQDAYKNGYRVYRNANISDYTKQYGKITKLVDWYSHILCVFEHGVAIIPVNERVESGEGIGGPVFINNSKVLSDTPSMISDKFGSQWKDSIIKTPYAVYGIDSSTKKIWKVTGSTTLPTLSVISDFKVENFLKENIPTLDNDIKKQVALRNIKTHYNQTKSDVIFTFYMTTEDRLAKGDNTGLYEQYDEKAWSLCLNEITSDQNSGNSGNFVTFYSWIPLESFNLNNKFYSFDREEVRGYLSFPEFDEPQVTSIIDWLGHDIYKYIDNSYIYTKNSDVNWCGDGTYSKKKYEFKNDCSEQKLNLWEHNNPSIRPLPTHWYGKQHPFEFEFMVVDDPSVQKIWEDLKIISNNAEPESFHFSITGDNYEFTNDIPNIYYRQEATKELYHTLGSHTSYNDDYTKVHPNQQIKSTIFPLYYNRLDMFDQIYDNYQKMTNNYRDYQNLSGTEVYRNPRSRKFELVTHIKNTPIDGQWVRLTEQNYQEYFDQELDKNINAYLEDRYVEYYQSKYTGEEISLCDTNFKTSTCLPKIKKEKKPKSAFLCDEEYWYYIWVPQSRLRGNSHYKEDKWNIQIPTMTFMQKNENRWKNGVPPLILNWIPKDIKKSEISNIDLPNTYDIGQISIARWTFRKETKLRDKYCRIKVRYSGEELAIISAILTTFNISYA